MIRGDFLWRDKQLHGKATKSDKRTLLLINPVFKQYRRTSYYSTRKVPPLAFMILGALTPKKEWDVKIVDEQIEKIEYNRSVDLVGITSICLLSNRCYQIADKFKARGVPVIIGGIHASMMPDEAAMHADSIVIGEAEEIWEKILNDFKENKLQSRYQASGFASLETHHPPITYDLINPKNYIAGIVQTSRGCPYKCEFCAVNTFFGSKIRHRAVEDVIKDIQVIPHKYVLIADDNFFGHSRLEMERAIIIMQELVKRKIKKKFYVQASVNFAEHDDVLYWANKSGIKMVCIGIESLNAEVIKGKMNKASNTKFVEDKYRGLIKKIHKANIVVKGTVIYNNDEETFDSIKDLINELRTSELDLVHISPIIPMPGTGLYYRLKKENRLMVDDKPENWERLLFTMTHKTKAIQSYKDSLNIRQMIIKTLYSNKEMIKRSIKTCWYTRSMLYALFCFATAVTTRKIHVIYRELQEELAAKKHVYENV